MQRQNYAIFNENDLNFMDCNKYLMPFKLMPVHLNCAAYVLGSDKKTFWHN